MFLLWQDDKHFLMMILYIGGRGLIYGLHLMLVIIFILSGSYTVNKNISTYSI